MQTYLLIEAHNSKLSSQNFFGLHALFSSLADVAIGAPMEGEDGSGAVYIYHGSDKGIELQYRQVLCIYIIFMINTIEFQKYRPLLLSELAGLRGRNFRVAATFG